MEAARLFQGILARLGCDAADILGRMLDIWVHLSAPTKLTWS